MDKVCNKIKRVLEIIMIILLMVMTLSVFIQVAARFVFNTGFAFTEELARYSNVWLVYMCAAVLIVSGDHISVTILDSMAKKQVKMLILFRILIYLIYSTGILYFGFQAIKVIAAQKSPNMQINMSLVYSVLPFAGGISILFLLNNFKKLFDKGEKIDD
ncbi:MAG: TRAP transporter small permease [Eubacteriales bacterium]